ncbi:MAG: HPr family phosphocarrier protein [Megasphaera sp.]|jgi:phosphotransferase system HPr (HPr) family protein|nr:HPr family phosphocarrier protein [Megasphaera sp.]
MMTEDFTLRAVGGLHARPAATFVKLCKTLTSEVTVTNKGRSVNAKNLIQLLSLGAGTNATIRVDVTGAAEAADMEAVRQCLRQLM